MSGYIGSKASVALVDGYTQAEAGAEFVDKAGDTMTGGLDVTGTVTATSFAGDGSGLTGVGGSGSGSTDAGAVGTYMWARGLGSALAGPAFNFGSTYSGSSLYPAGFASQASVSSSGSWSYSSGVGIGIGPTDTVARSGTWRCMGQTPTPSFDENPTTLFVRIS
jgi:hypothetical protein